MCIFLAETKKKKKTIETFSKNSVDENRPNPKKH